MSIQVTSGFDVRSRSPIDDRLTLSKSQMRNINDKLMPERYFALCIDDSQFYIYKKTNALDKDTGRFRLANADLIEDVKQLQIDSAQLQLDVEELEEDVEEIGVPLTDDEIKDITK